MTHQTFGPSTKSRAKTTTRFVEFKIWVVFRSLVANEGLLYIEIPEPFGKNRRFFPHTKPAPAGFAFATCVRAQCCAWVALLVVLVKRMWPMPIVPQREQ